MHSMIIMSSTSSLLSENQICRMKAALIFLSVGSSVVSVTAGGNACCRCSLPPGYRLGWMGGWATMNALIWIRVGLFLTAKHRMVGGISIKLPAVFKINYHGNCRIADAASLI